MSNEHSVYLDCGSCIVRNWRQEDGESLIKLADNRAIWRNLAHRFPHPYTADDAAAWLTLSAAPECTHWAIEVDGIAAGGVGVELGEGIYEKSGQIGYWLGEPYWGRGIATAAVRKTADYAMPRYGLARLHASVFEWNPASMRVLEKCGFVREGVLHDSIFKDGRIIDAVLYARVVSNSAHNPLAWLC